MMKHISSMVLLAAFLFTACQRDDTDFSAYTTDSGVVTTIYIHYDGPTASVKGDSQGVVSVKGADVTVNSQFADSLLLVLSGTSSDGSLLVLRSRRYGLLLDGLTLTNADGPAINNQGHKSLFVHCAAGTSNTLADGTSYAASPFDQKGTLFSEGQLIFLGPGALSVTARCKNAIASDDYIVIADGADVKTVTTETGSNGLKCNDGFYIHGGALTVDVSSPAGRGIRCDSVVVVTGGVTSITTSGDCRTEIVDGVEDITSAACIKNDASFRMTGGTLTMRSMGDGGKGINCSSQVLFSGGTLTAITTGSNVNGKPKAVKGSAITISGGSFLAQVNKSWACDNGYESLDDADQSAHCVTVVGTPRVQTLQKRLVNIVY